MYGTVRTVVWEDGGGDPSSYPMFDCGLLRITSVDGVSVAAFQGGIPNLPDQVTPFAPMAQ